MRGKRGSKKTDVWPGSQHVWRKSWSVAPGVFQNMLTNMNIADLPLREWNLQQYAIITLHRTWLHVCQAWADVFMYEVQLHYHISLKFLPFVKGKCSPCISSWICIHENSSAILRFESFRLILLFCLRVEVWSNFADFECKSVVEWKVNAFNLSCAWFTNQKFGFY